MTQSKQPLFGRAWGLTVVTSEKTYTVSSSAWDPEALRIRFEVNLALFVRSWDAKIEIYNPNNGLMQAVLKQGQSVSLQAGYQQPGAQTIFEGQIYQPMWELENGVDYKLTLLCYTGLKETVGNLSSFSGIQGQDQAGLISQMCANAHTPIKPVQIDTTALPSAKLSRARAFFGNPSDFIDTVARRTGVQTWTGFDGLHLGNYEANDATPTITYSPSTGLIGTPQQTQDGIEFTVLLDPRLVITGSPNQVKLEGSQIRQLARPDPLRGGTYQPLLNPKGTYIVIGVTFVGDSRGNDWFAHVVAVYTVGGKWAMLMNPDNSTTNTNEPLQNPYGSN